MVGDLSDDLISGEGNLPTLNHASKRCVKVRKGVLERQFVKQPA